MTVLASSTTSPVDRDGVPAFARYFAAAGRLLVAGTVEHGDERGRELGFPTANLAIDDTVARDGVWAGRVLLECGETYASAVSIGRRATGRPRGRLAGSEREQVAPQGVVRVLRARQPAPLEFRH